MVRLWTIQTEPAVAALLRGGRLRGASRHVDPALRSAYRWMMDRFAQRVAPPARRTVYPVWAWRQFVSIARPRPDLRATGHLLRGTRGVLVVFDQPAERILLSDFQKWHMVLNRSYLPATLADARRFERALARAGVRDAWPYPAPFHDRVVASWDRIFDMEAPATDCWEGPEARQIQAVTWQVDHAEVIETRSFVAA